MARGFTDAQRALLRAPSVRLRILMAFYLDEGTFRFTDDVINVWDGEYEWIGAQPLASSVEIRSGRDLAAEPATLILDGNRMTQAGIEDPGKVLAQIMHYLHQQRRVNCYLGISYPNQHTVNIRIPIAALKINHVRKVEKEMNFEEGKQEVVSELHIIMDSLAARYSRAPFRTRSHDDQLEIDPTDMFFSFVDDALNTERSLYWGRKAPTASNYGGNNVYGGILGGAFGSNTTSYR
jgi:hypothetical protein